MKLMLAVAIAIPLDALLHFKKTKNAPGEFFRKWTFFLAAGVLYGALFWVTEVLLA